MTNATIITAPFEYNWNDTRHFENHHLVGTIIDTLDGKATVEDVYSKEEVWIKFHNTGYQCATTLSKVNRGKASDPTAPTIAGVGYMGEGEYGCSTHNREYHLWHNMIRRCYQVDNRPKNFKAYENVSVHPDWHNFQTFCEDIQYLIGYDDWFANEERYCLDKDLGCKAYGLTNKIYSKETCSFLTVAENLAIIER